LQQIDFGRKYIRLNRPVKTRLDVKNLIVTVCFLTAVLALSVYALMMGTIQLSIADIFAVFSGELTGFEQTVVIEWRLPRVFGAIFFGAGLAVSGSIFQSITRNPLGSPDILGFSTGSYTGALIVMLVIKSFSFPAIAAGALIGGLATAFIIYLFAFRQGTQSFRLIIVGIAISNMLGSLNSLMLLKSQDEVALTAGAWAVGSLNGVSWANVLPAIAAEIVLLILASVFNTSLCEMELGRDVAISHGVHFEKTQLVLILIAVGLTASATAIIGPVAFVALAAPQIAHHFTRTSSSLAPTAAVGAFVMLSADVLAQQIIPDAILPVGVLTLSIGGLYLVWVLFQQARAAA
jgi:iron complex transport system permease protein